MDTAGDGETQQRELPRWKELATAPAPLSRQHLIIGAVTALLVAISRIWARSKTLWDWDEALFVLALRDYDVSLHHPHPPGFPVFIALARFASLVTSDEFRALQLVNVIASCLIFPALFFLARELRFPLRVCYSAALVGSLLPTVWLYGGTAFSDVTALLFVIAANAFLLAGCRNRDAYFAGALLLALAVGIRPQNALLGLAPALIATFFAARRSLLEPILGFIIGSLVVASAYGSAAHATGVDRYRETTKAHRDYIVRTDSYANPQRAPLSELARRHFLRPTRAGSIDYLITLFVLATVIGGIVSRSLPIVIALATFVPYQIFSWLMLDPLGHGRLSLGYIPLYAIACAAGVWMILRQRTLAAFVLAAIVIIATHRAAAAIQILRTTDSPPAAAAAWITANAKPTRDTIYVAEGLHPQVDALLPHFRRVRVEETKSIPLDQASFYVVPAVSAERDAVVFSRERRPLWSIVRRFFFDVSVVPLRSLVSFEDGWYAAEEHGSETWRWMRQIGAIRLPAARDARLELQMTVPLDALSAPPVIALALNGKEFDRFVASERNVRRSYRLAANDRAPNLLHISTSEVVRPAARGVSSDGRELGIQLHSIEWTETEPAAH